MTRAKTTSKDKPRDGDARATISVRGVSVARWKAVQEKAERKGLKLKYALDEIFDDWLKKTP